MVYRSGPRWTTLQRLEKDLAISFEPEDGDGMSLHGSKRTIQNGYSHRSSLSFAALECHAQLVTASPSCPPGSSTARWGKCQKLQHNSASVRDRLRECGFVKHLRQTQTPLPSRKCALELPTQFIGQRNCGAPVCVVDQQSGSVGETQPSGRSEAKQHTFDKPSDLEPSSVERTEHKSMGHVAEDDNGPRSTQVIFSTEVPQDSTLARHRGGSDSVEGNLSPLSYRARDLSGETYVFGSKKTQRVLRDQICRVVVNLEEVLCGLKEVHLEMKEVVREIDLLTSDIDLGEDGEDSSRRTPASEEQNDTSGHQSTVSSVQASGKEHKTMSRLPPPAYPSGHVGPNRSNHGESESKGAKGPRSQKPPPYPFRANKGRDPGPKTPLCSGRRKLLSTTV